MFLSAETRCSNRALRRALAEIRDKSLEEGLGAVVQQELLRPNDTCHDVLTAVHDKVTEDSAAKEADRALTAQAASKRELFSVSMQLVSVCSSTNGRLCCAAQSAYPDCGTQMSAVWQE